MKKKTPSPSGTFGQNAAPLSADQAFDIVLRGATKGNADITRAGIDRCDLNRKTPMGDTILAETLLAYWNSLIEARKDISVVDAAFPETVSQITHSKQVMNGTFDLSTPNPSGADALVIARDLHKAFGTKGTQRVVAMIERAVEKQMLFHGLCEEAGKRRPASKAGYVLPVVKKGS